MKTVTKIQQRVSPFQSKKKVAAYIRVSHSNLEHSFSNQVSYYNDFIQNKREWEFVGVYADFAISGKSQKERPEFRRLISDCRNGKINCILTKSISRFGRNTLELLETVRELRRLEIEVVFEKENIRTLSVDGELLLTLLASFAQEESTSLSQNIKWRVKERFKQGLPYIPQAIYGYRWNGEKYIIKPHEAEIVRKVFTWYLDGLGVPSIAKKLNDMGETTRLGNIFTKSILYEFFKQEAYFGRLVLQKTYRNDFNRSPKRNTGQRTKYIVDNAHEAIISKELFDKAQAEKKIRSKGRCYRKCYDDAFFKDKVFCQQCGRDMLITKEKKFGYRYNCRTRQQYGISTCPSKTLSERRLVRTVKEQLGDYLGSIQKVMFDSSSNQVTLYFDDDNIQILTLKRGQLK
ncbi:recombinase family protein [Streptococcus himalayensis]|uniref:Serine recombinase n=1 Tax=Streptococcus himalayensis TaxID=1888195 RepID=A0A917A4T6_9STRE|nr:recombinase family protein [Streptococcus himalayensis]QBX16517.1 site-specific recombinase [Streptococcus phage Javan255]GGE26793.1 serine recombinase [Streptococcus himalayensis]